MAIGIPCIRTIVDLSTVGRLKISVIRKAIDGRNIILSRLNLKALTMFVYFLP